MNHSHIITVLLGIGVLSVLLAAIWLLESNPDTVREEQQSPDIFE